MTLPSGTPYQTTPPDLPVQRGSVLLVVLLSVFLGGALILLTALLIVCHRCRHGDRYTRASDDPEKTTYREDYQPTHEVTILVEEADCSSSSAHDLQTERFLSTGATGRRVSFNEAALCDHAHKAPEKGRRYTLTEGDFHHLKNARLTHFQVPPPPLQGPPPALHILTIHEWESSVSGVGMATCPDAKSALSIFQPVLCPLPQTALTSLSVSTSSALSSPALPGPAPSSSALPGDTLSSMVDSRPPLPPPAARSKIEEGGDSRTRGSPGGPSVCEGGAAPGPQGPVLQFFRRLRRHASLEGPSPYFSIKRWRLDSSHRASSLDTRGSPKRRQFQRQRAASESLDQDDPDAHHIELVQYIARTRDSAHFPGHSPRLLNPPSTPPPSLGRLEVEAMVEPHCSSGGAGVIGLTPEAQSLPGFPWDSPSPGHWDSPSPATAELPPDLQDPQVSPPDPSDPSDPQAGYRDIWTLRASLERCVSDHSSSNNDRDSTGSAWSAGGRGGPPSSPSQDLGEEEEEEEGEEEEALGEEEEVREEKNGRGRREGEEDGKEDGKEEGKEGRRREGKQDSVESERGRGGGGGGGGGSNGESGTRKLLQMDSGYASIEAPPRAYDDPRLFPGGGGGGGGERTAREKRLHFTSAGRSSTVGESFQEEEPEEEEEEEGWAEACGGDAGRVAPDTGAGPLGWAPYGQMFTPREAYSPPLLSLLPSSTPAHPPPAFRRRDYSIDEKTDALFHEFLRHDPRLDQQPESPLRRRRSRVYLRKQWQRRKQSSDPGAPRPPPSASFDRQRTPLRRGDSVDCPLESGYRGTLPRIASAPDNEEAAAAASDPQTTGGEEEEAGGGGGGRGSEEENRRSRESLGGRDDEEDRSPLPPPPPPPPPPQAGPPADESWPPLTLTPALDPGFGPQTVWEELSDKWAGLEDRLYAGLRRPQDAAECAVVVMATAPAVRHAHTSPDHSPV